MVCCGLWCGVACFHLPRRAPVVVRLETVLARGEFLGRLPGRPLAEDEAVIAMALADDLEAAGYAVAGAFATCESALEWLKGETPDLAVLDPMLKDGICRSSRSSCRGAVFRL